MNSYSSLGSLSSDALMLVFWLSLPALAVATGLGVLIGLVQSVTQIQDQALPYGAKIIGVGLVMIVAMPWGNSEVTRFLEHAFSYIAAGEGAVTSNYIGYLEGFAFCTIRPAVALSLIPFGGNESLGVALRLPLMVMFAIMPQQIGWPDNAIVATSVEVLIGLILGLLLSVPFHAAAAAGALVDQQGGYSIGAAYDPNFRDEAALFQRLFIWFATLTFFAGRGLEAVYGFFADAWALWPPGALRADHMRVMRELAQERLALSIVEGVRIAMPLIGMMLLVDVSLGLMSRYAKRLNPFTTARTVKAIVLSLTIVSCVPVLFERLNAIFLQSALLQ